MLTVKIFLSTQTEKNVTLKCKMAKILTISRKSQHPLRLSYIQIFARVIQMIEVRKSGRGVENAINLPVFSEKVAENLQYTFSLIKVQDLDSVE